MIAHAMHPSQRVCILGDADNIEIAGRGVPRRSLDYSKLLAMMHGRQVVRKILYRPTHRFSGYIERQYKRAGFEVKRTKANSDPWMMTDAIGFARHYDVVAFLSGDHFVGVIAPLLRSFGAKVEAWGWSSSTAEEVKEGVDEFVALPADLILNK